MMLRVVMLARRRRVESEVAGEVCCLTRDAEPDRSDGAGARVQRGRRQESLRLAAPFTSARRDWWRATVRACVWVGTARVARGTGQGRPRCWEWEDRKGRKW